jgi:hypothetical protein
MAPPPAITGEGFNWGYFIGAIQSSAYGSGGPTFPVALGDQANNIFDVPTLWIFQDYNYRNISPGINPVFPPYPGWPSLPIPPPPYKGRFRLGGGYGPAPSYTSGPPVKLYADGFVGTVVTLNEGSTLTIDGSAFTLAGQIFDYNDLYNFPTYVASYSGMHHIT